MAPADPLPTSSLAAVAEEVIRLDAEATEGPWTSKTHLECRESGGWHVADCGWGGAPICNRLVCPSEEAMDGDGARGTPVENAALIASYRTSAPALARAVIALEAAVARLRKVAEAAEGMATALKQSRDVIWENRCHVAWTSVVEGATGQADAALSAYRAALPATAPEGKCNYCGDPATVPMPQDGSAWPACARCAAIRHKKVGGDGS